jgi:hypothetical protein
MSDSIPSRNVPPSGYCRRVPIVSLDREARNLVTIVTLEEPWASSFWA